MIKLTNEKLKDGTRRKNFDNSVVRDPISLEDQL